MSSFNIGQAAANTKIAARQTAQLNSAQKNDLLHAIADRIDSQVDAILSANAMDIQSAKEKQLANAMVDRLLLNPERIQDIASAIREIAGLTDPVGDIANIATRPNGIQVGKMRIPLGVVAMIYEARPNVTAEAAALCLKSGNGVILRGGSEAIHSNRAIAQCLHDALEQKGLNPNMVCIVPDTSREVIEDMLTLNDSIDLVIPRGGEGLIRYVTNNSRIPVIQHFKGVCHLFIDKFADEKKALAILLNGKTQRPSACNALETVLIHQDIAEQILPKINQAFSTKMAPEKVTVHACESSLPFFDSASLASEDDYHAEYLAQEIAVKVVASFDDAVAHIHQYTSDHTEVIVSQDTSRCQAFLRQINASVVMTNASSRFSDGGQLGLGAEIGISTSKLHAYGPMGLASLTTEKFIVIGDGQIRD